MYTCKACGVELIEGTNWYPSHKKSRKYLCNDCYAVSVRKYQPRDTVYKRMKYNEIRLKILGLLGNRCDKCGFDDIRALQSYKWWWYC